MRFACSLSLPLSLSALVVSLAACSGPAATGDAAPTADTGGPVDAAPIDAGLDAATALDAPSSVDAAPDASLDAGALDVATEAARICRLWATHECERRAYCNESQGLSVAECTDRQSRSCAPAFERALVLATTSSATYDASRVDACTASFPACGAFQSAPEACVQILVGHVPDGSQCETPLGGLAGTCATGNCRAEATCSRCVARPGVGMPCSRFEFDRACTDDAVCTMAGTCIARLALGASCSRTGFVGVDPCALGLVCGPGGTCVDPPAIGQSCTDVCERGASCSGGMCRSLYHVLAAGDACGFDFACPVGLRCLVARGGGANVCRTPDAVDEACVPHSCADGLFCNVSGAGVCRPYPVGTAGSPCDVSVCPIEAGTCCDPDLECDVTSQRCVAHTIHGDGEACGTPDVVCAAPGACVGGVCAGYRDLGETCTLASDCLFGLDCTASRCATRAPASCP